jgi:hypothetical protein
MCTPTTATGSRVQANKPALGSVPTTTHAKYKMSKLPNIPTTKSPKTQVRRTCIIKLYVHIFCEKEIFINLSKYSAGTAIERNPGFLGKIRQVLLCGFFASIALHCHKSSEIYLVDALQLSMRKSSEIN